MLLSDCCNALPWKLEVYDNLGICSECKENSSFTETPEDDYFKDIQQDR